MSENTQQGSNGQHPENNQHPEGYVSSSGVLCGCIGVLVSLILHELGLFGAVDHSLYELVVNNLRLDLSTDSLALVTLAIVAVICSIGVAWSILDSRGTWRRIVIFVSAMILVVATVPTLAVWNIYFSPFLVLMSLFCSSLCAMIYASNHRMSCDISE